MSLTSKWPFGGLTLSLKHKIKQHYSLTVPATIPMQKKTKAVRDICPFFIEFDHNFAIKSP